MLTGFLVKLRQQLIMLAVVSVVLLAAYVSAGRQFMPAISRYAGYFEEQVFLATGLPVSVDSLQGEFIGFNPSVTVNGLSLLVEPRAEDNTGRSVRFDSASVTVDMPRSIWERQWVLEEFAIDNLSIDVEQLASGSFVIRGINNAADADTDLDRLYQSLLRVARLDLRNVEINIRLNDGDEIQFENGTATIQNLNSEHYLHINTNIAGRPEQLAFSLEVSGSRLRDAKGFLHLAIPEGDYSQLLHGQSFEGVEIVRLQGGANIWVELNSGRAQRIIAQPAIDVVTLTANGSNSTLGNIAGSLSANRDAEDGQWRLLASDLTVQYGGVRWNPFDAYLHYAPERGIDVRASHIDLTLLAQFAAESGLLAGAIKEEIASFRPRGMLNNFSLYFPLGEEPEESLRLRTNVANVAVDSVRGSPQMRGINGYVEADFDPRLDRGGGFAEVESNEFTINVPNVFSTTWAYDYVNGRLGFGIDLSDGLEVKLASSTIFVESDAIRARVKFTNIVEQPRGGERQTRLEMLVGIQELDAEFDYRYTPDGNNIAENLYNSMEFLRGAIRDGRIVRSGAVYRGSTVPGSPAATKTFQSFFNMEEGEFVFNPEWPGLQNLSALVLADDNDIDINVRGGRSMGIEIAGITGTVRRDEQDSPQLKVSGDISGRTGDGLAYLQTAPIGEDFKNTISTWQAEGGFSGNLAVRVPLPARSGSPENRVPDIHLNFQMAGNRLHMPEFDLDVTNLSGPVIFDTENGLEDSLLTGSLFDGEVRVNLSSDVSAGRMQTIYVDGSGRTTPQAMTAWPRQNPFVRTLLGGMNGEFAYRARLNIDQTGNAGAGNRLTVSSDLVGTRMDLPMPYRKPPRQPMGLNLQIDFGEGTQDITGSLGPATRFDLKVAGDKLVDGLVVLGRRQTPPVDPGAGETRGLVVTGRMDRFHVQQWVDFFAGMSGGNSSADMGESIALIEVDTGIFELYEQELPRVHMRIEPDVTSQGWLARLTGEAVQGWVTIPYNANAYLDIELDHLHLPGNEEEAAPLDPDRVDASIAQAFVEEEPRIDALAGIDPRTLPAMRFSTGEFSIGERPFGRWKFTLNPTITGAEFSDLAFDFRGMRLGLEPVPQTLEQLVPHFTWSYDGEAHHSSLTGVILADDMADVLTANGIAPSLESSRASFVTKMNWPGTPVFFSGDHLSGAIDVAIDDGRFLQGSGGNSALKLISIINFSAILRRLRFSDDLLRRGLAFDEIRGEFLLDNGIMTIQDQLVITGPSSLYQFSGNVNLAEETISGEMYLTLPVSDNLPWIGLLTANPVVAVGAYLFDRIFGNQINSLTSAVYTLEGPWEGLEPQFKQAFGSPPSESGAATN